MKKRSILLSIIVILLITTLLLMNVFTSNRYALLCGIITPVLVAVGLVIYFYPKKLNS